MEHIGIPLGVLLGELGMNRDEKQVVSIICRKGAICEQLREFAESYAESSDKEVFRLELSLKGGTVGITIDRYKEVRDELPERGSNDITAEDITDAFSRVFGGDEK